jgi:hypothetical protein
MVSSLYSALLKTRVLPYNDFMTAANTVWTTNFCDGLVGVEGLVTTHGIVLHSTAVSYPVLSETLTSVYEEPFTYCTPETDVAFCSRVGGPTTCAEAVARDNCGSTRKVLCGCAFTSNTVDGTSATTAIPVAVGSSLTQVIGSLRDSGSGRFASARFHKVTVAPGQTITASLDAASFASGLSFGCGSSPLGVNGGSGVFAIFDTSKMRVYDVPNFLPTGIAGPVAAGQALRSMGTFTNVTASPQDVIACVTADQGMNGTTTTPVNRTPYVLTVTAAPAGTVASTLKSILIAPSVTATTALVGASVYLDQPSAGARVVSVTSSNPAIVVPASVTIPAGAASVVFYPTMNNVTAATPVTLSATLDNTTTTCATVVNPAPVKVKSLTWSNTYTRSGDTVTATVSLFGVTPAAASVSLTTISLVTIPATVVVPAGASSVTFTVKVPAASALGAVRTTVTAKLGTTAAVSSAFLTYP